MKPQTPLPNASRRELDRPKVGRKARRDDAAETVVRSFPASGSVKYTEWEHIARDNCNWDHGKIADAFRSFCAGKNIRLDAKNIEEIFKNFCAKQRRI